MGYYILWNCSEKYNLTFLLTFNRLKPDQIKTCLKKTEYKLFGNPLFYK